MDSEVGSTRQVLGIDPGDMTGWSLVADPGGHEIAHGIEKYDHMLEWLDKFLGLYGPTNTVVVEDYALFKSKAIQQSGSKLNTVRVIGMVMFWAFRNKVPVVYQSPQIKSIAERFSQRKPTGRHSKSHDIDAYNHAIYYLAKMGRYDVELPADS